MSQANKMREALAKIPRVNLVEPSELMQLTGNGVRLDAYSNEVTGLGTARDKTYYNSFSADRVLMDAEIAAIYHGNDLAARLVDIVPDEMYREGFDVDLGDQKLNTEVADQLDALGMVDKLADAVRWGRCYGGGGILLGADDGRSAATPLMPERAKALSYCYVVDKRYLWPLTYYREAGHTKLGQPETYMVTSPSFHTDAPIAVVHESRLVLFGGATTGIREREANSGWDFSILQRANKVLSDFEMGWGAVSVLIADGNQAVLRISGLADAISQPGGAEAYLRERLKFIDMGRSVVRAMVLDAGDPDAKQPAEDFTRQVFPMTGLPETLEKLMVRLAATGDVPVTKLFGISPAGLNATGESDIRMWYDRIRSAQARKQAPKIRRIIRVMLQTKVVSESPTAIKVNFPSLWSESPSQAATTRKTKLEGDAIAITNGMVTAESAGVQRFSPGGFDKELTLTAEEKTAREAALEDELERIESGAPDPNEPPTSPFGGAPFGGGGSNSGAPKAQPLQRTDGDDQPRDELGQFAETDGGGGSDRPSRAERTAMARERHAEATINHAEAERKLAEATSAHDQNKQAISSGLDARAEAARGLAKEAQTTAAKAKDQQRGFTKRERELEKASGGDVDSQEWTDSATFGSLAEDAGADAADARLCARQFERQAAKAEAAKARVAELADTKPDAVEAHLDRLSSNGIDELPSAAIKTEQRADPGYISARVEAARALDEATSGKIDDAEYEGRAAPLKAYEAREREAYDRELARMESGYETPAIEALQSAAADLGDSAERMQGARAKVERTARAARTHEREVQRLSKETS